MIEFDCPLCGVRLHARVHYSGRLAQCTSCEQSIEVPTRNQVSEDDILGWLDSQPSSAAGDEDQEQLNQQTSDRSKNSPNDLDDGDRASIRRDVEITHQNPTRKRYLSPIPDGYQIYVAQTAVAGSHFRRAQVERLFKFQKPSIDFEPEPTNSHDPNAIKVIAYNGDSHSSIHVGYVPSKLAKQFARSGVVKRLHPRLRMVQIGDYVEVEFDVCGPKAEKSEFDKVT
jgi:hypothetical protein